MRGDYFGAEKCVDLGKLRTEKCGIGEWGGHARCPRVVDIPSL